MTQKRFAFLGTSQAGGVYRVFETLRDGLAPLGWHGDFIAGPPDFDPTRSWEDGIPAIRAFIDRLAGYDAIIANAFVERRLMNAVRYLPSSLPRMLIVHNITFATYRAARALRDHVQFTTGVSPRITRDLVAKQGFDPARVRPVFNAVPDEFFTAPILPAGDGAPLAALSLGRLDENAKAVSLLPEFFRDLAPESYGLTIAGDGPDEAMLSQAVAEAGTNASFIGRVERQDLIRIYGRHNVFLFPSRFEGMGLTLAEAMAAGLVPVAARIPGVTDAMIVDGESGFLFAQGDMDGARAAIKKLMGDSELHERMRHAARARASELFRVDDMIAAYAGALETITAAEPKIAGLTVEDWQLAPEFRRGWRALLPKGLRSLIARKVLYR